MLGFFLSFFKRVSLCPQHPLAVTFVKRTILNLMD